jgi:phage baseplate assembly protein W
MPGFGKTRSQLRSFSKRLKQTMPLERNPIGISTPLEAGRNKPGESLFKMHFDIKDQIADNLKNLIVTQKGERLGFSDFGTNLSQIYSSNLSKEEILETAIAEIQSVVSKYMPSIELNDYYSQRLDAGQESNYSKLTAKTGKAFYESLDEVSKNSNFVGININDNVDNIDIDQIYKIEISYAVPSISKEQYSIKLFIRTSR